MKNNPPKGAPLKRSKGALPAKADNAKTKSLGLKPDPRKVPPPTAPASVAAKAAEAISPAISVATAEPKKASAANATPAQAPKREASGFGRSTDTSKAVAGDASPTPGNAPKVAEAAPPPWAGAKSANSPTGALVELNGKVLELWRAQGEAAVDLWRSTVSAGSLAEAVRVQTSGFRQSYETNLSRWKDIAETATRAMGQAAQTIQSAMNPPR